jgi:membrane protein implicated in regulation of membrane protease activity
MYLVVIAWLYVTLMMAVAEAANPTGSILGAVVTFALYGLLPLSIVIYIMGTPARRRKRHARELAERQAWLARQQASQDSPDAQARSVPPDAGSEAAAAAQADSIAPVRKEP